MGSFEHTTDQEANLNVDLNLMNNDSISLISSRVQKLSTSRVFTTLFFFICLFLILLLFFE